MACERDMIKLKSLLFLKDKEQLVLLALTDRKLLLERKERPESISSPSQQQGPLHSLAYMFGLYTMSTKITVFLIKGFIILLVIY